MHNHETDMLWWTNNLQSNQGVNYSLGMVTKLKTGGNKKWLASLPMYEYAYVLLTATMYRLGGKPEDYIEDLYKQRMAPILDAYYKKLAEYRVNCLLIARHDESMHAKLKTMSMTDETAKMRLYAYKTRKALRSVCDDVEEERADPNFHRSSTTHNTMPETFS